MLSNYVAVALRNLGRNGLYSGISILALAVGLCGALLAGVTLRNELLYEHFIPGHEHTYLAAAVAIPTGHPPLVNDASPSFVGALLKLNIPGIEAVSRIASAEVRLRHEKTTAKETIYWADPNIFELLPLPALAGELREALRRPDGIVLTRIVAAKYFGAENPIGHTLWLDDTHLMTVTAVLDDLPVGSTELETGIFASGLAANSTLSTCDRNAQDNAKTGAISLCSQTYIRLAPTAKVARVQHAIDGFLPKVYPKFPGMTMSVRLIRIDHVHLFEALNPGMRARLAMIGAVALAILFTACVVYINLATARSAKRALEVGVRKACGASRAQLILQFLGESLIFVTLAACLGLVLAHLALPYANAFLNCNGRLDLAHDPTLVATTGVGIAIVSVIAGAYPAFVVSAFNPSAVLKGSVTGLGGELARKALVILQFSVLIVLLIAAIVIYRQRLYAMHDALRVNTDQVLILRSPCRDAILNELRALPGVRGAFCSEDTFLDRGSFGNFRLLDGSDLAIDSTVLDLGVFGIYDIRPVAGVFPTDDYANRGPAQNNSQVVINESAARRFGFKTPADSIGQLLPFVDNSRGSKQIVAVVPDFAFDAGLQGMRPAMYEGSNADARNKYGIIHIKLAGRDIPETLEAIDRIHMMAAPADGSLPERFFVDQYVQNLYAAVLREAQALAVFAAVAVVLAGLGLIGLSAATAERRTREIGIRKALGAGNSDILRMLLWQFGKPILWANLVAWPVSAVLLRRWLEGFPDHIILNPLMFVAASALALAVAMVTVAGHATWVARGRPVEALRYE